MEKEVTGMYLSGHPMSPYAEVYNAGIAARFDEIACSAAGESDQYKDCLLYTSARRGADAAGRF